MTVTPGVAVRRVERRDLGAILRIERAAFKQPWTRKAFGRLLDEPGFLVATRPAGGERSVVGYVVGDVTPNHGRDIGHVKNLAVRRDSRGAGVGRRLLRGALAALAAEGAARARLEVRASNDVARSLYRSEGFEPVRRLPGYYSDGETAIVMALELAG